MIYINTLYQKEMKIIFIETLRLPKFSILAPLEEGEEEEIRERKT